MPSQIAANLSSKKIWWYNWKVTHNRFFFKSAKISESYLLAMQPWWEKWLMLVDRWPSQTSSDFQTFSCVDISSYHQNFLCPILLQYTKVQYHSRHQWKTIHCVSRLHGQKIAEKNCISLQTFLNDLIFCLDQSLNFSN